ncbi:hypothetical protein VSU19_10860 [Verrucomicrobiales bacterium BCK34]|nr:hypothetical protein [Verrucomicrobiales bacterium BCK34]
MNNSSPELTGKKVGDYTLIKKCGQGAIGSVYKAVNDGDVKDVRAIKLIESKNLRDNWVQEINKTTQIQNFAPVVSFIANGTIDFDDTNYTWIAWRFVKGKSVSETIKLGEMTLPLLREIIVETLAVLFSCDKAGIQHGDLHAGNIMIEDANPLSIDSSNKVLVTDFGYLTASQGFTMLDDFQGLSIIVKDSLESINFHTLDGRDKAIYRKLKEQNQQLLLDADRTEYDYARDPQKLREEFLKIFSFDPSQKKELNRSVSDYLAAEILGENYDEWQALFVPDFIGADRLVERNTTVLTGLRGCGKTTVFRRLSAEMNIRLGGPPKIAGADNFIGFYFNARSVAEAFPWLPDKHRDQARQQILHFFHSSWILEILDWLILSTREKESFSWIIQYFRQLFGDRLTVTSTSVHGLRQLKVFFEKERERARLKAAFVESGWELNSITLLEEVAQYTINARGLVNQPFYFFLDDYSTPLVTRSIQQILNAIVFRRGTNAIFKIATESTESLEYIGLNNKALELDDDFALIDSAYESLQEPRKKRNRELLNSILSRRIVRDEAAAKHASELVDIVGKTPFSYNDLARTRREGASKKKVIYSGEKIFCDIWSSNTREIIRLFSEILRSAEPEDFPKLRRLKEPLVSPNNQNSVFRAAGGKYRDVLRAASNPTKNLWERNAKSDESFGDKLVSIADAFSEMAIQELLSKDTKNGSTIAPKQAR